MRLFVVLLVFTLAGCAQPSRVVQSDVALTSSSPPWQLKTYSRSGSVDALLRPAAQSSTQWEFRASGSQSAPLLTLVISDMNCDTGFEVRLSYQFAPGDTRFQKVHIEESIAQPLDIALQWNKGVVDIAVNQHRLQATIYRLPSELSLAAAVGEANLMRMEYDPQGGSTHETP